MREENPKWFSGSNDFFTHFSIVFHTNKHRQQLNNKNVVNTSNEINIDNELPESFNRNRKNEW